jgi:hypothetical protein
MKTNTSKTAFQAFSLSYKTIYPWLRFKGTALFQSNKFKYLSVTSHNKLNWKNHVDKISSTVSKEINMLKRLAQGKWGCTQSTPKPYVPKITSSL